MDVGIIGLAGSGKTTLFNALTGSEAETGAFHAQGAEPNVAVVKVPDARMDRLIELYKPKKVVHATITYIDVAGISTEEGRSSGALDDALIKAVANADALMAVIRGFDAGGVAARVEADLDTLVADLILTDLERTEQRLERIEKSIAKITGDKRKELEVERATLRRCHEALEAEKPIRAVEFSEAEEKILRAFQFVTIKPLIIVVNVGEDEIERCGEWEKKIEDRGLAPMTRALACSALTEMEISRIEDEEERVEFLSSYGIEQPAAARIILSSYETLGLIAFFTAGEKEVHAWTLRRGLSVVKGAGTIHSDMERGFIRAEVIGCDELLRQGSFAAARKEGTLRVEGKGYLMEDGDVIEIRFSV